MSSIDLSMPPLSALGEMVREQPEVTITELASDALEDDEYDELELPLFPFEQYRTLWEAILAHL